MTGFLPLNKAACHAPPPAIIYGGVTNPLIISKFALKFLSKLRRSKRLTARWSDKLINEQSRISWSQDLAATGRLRRTA
jgi:hypothetical protein